MKSLGQNGLKALAKAQSRSRKSGIGIEAYDEAKAIQLERIDAESFDDALYDTLAKANYERFIEGDAFPMAEFVEDGADSESSKPFDEMTPEEQRDAKPM